MWITNAAVPLGVPSIERDGHPFFGFWKNRTRTPNSTLIYRFCFAVFEEFLKRHFTSNLRFTDSELVLIDYRNRTCYLWFSEKPAFGCYDTSWVSDSLSSISTKLRMCSKIFACIMNYTVWPRWSPNEEYADTCTWQMAAPCWRWELVVLEVVGLKCPGPRWPVEHKVPEILGAGLSSRNFFQNGNERPWAIPLILTWVRPL